MKCLLKYRWVKLPRAQLPQGKGVAPQWKYPFRPGKVVRAKLFRLHGLSPASLKQIRKEYHKRENYGIIRRNLLTLTEEAKGIWPEPYIWSPPPLAI